MDGTTDPLSSGSSSYPSLPWSSVLRARAMENSYYSASGTSGTVLHNVNMMTGQPVYSVPIGEISAGGPVRFPIAFTYAGSVRPLFDADNEKGPTSWIGYGWNFTTPFVAVNHKGTASIFDDVYYCNLGPYGGGRFDPGFQRQVLRRHRPHHRGVAPRSDVYGHTLKMDLQVARRLADGIRHQSSGGLRVPDPQYGGFHNNGKPLHGRFRNSLYLPVGCVPDGRLSHRERPRQ